MTKTLVANGDYPERGKDRHRFNWPMNYELMIDFDHVPTIWVDDILEIDPDYLRMKGLA